MPRRGWTTVDVPEGWLKVIRGQRPPSVKWAKAEKKTERKSSAAPQNPRQPPGPSRSPPSKTPMPAQEVGPRVSRDPDQVVSEAQSRVVKLEAAISALGENDPAVPRLREELQRVRSQAQVVDQRITWTQEFIARAQKRVEGMRTDLVKAQEAVAKAQETLRHEEALLRDGEARLVALQEESRRAPQCGPVPPVTPVHFATELATLRECVQQLLRERDELKAELCAVGGREESRSKKTRTLATPAPDLMLTDHDSLTVPSATRSGLLESMINQADSAVRASASRAGS